MANGDTIAGLLASIGIILSAFKADKRRLNKRLLRRAFKNYRKIKKIMKKDDGVITKKEQLQLEELKDKIISASIKLIDF